MSGMACRKAFCTTVTRIFSEKVVCAPVPPALVVLGVKATTLCGILASAAVLEGCSVTASATGRAFGARRRLSADLGGLGKLATPQNVLWRHSFQGNSRACQGAYAVCSVVGCEARYMCAWLLLGCGQLSVLTPNHQLDQTLLDHTAGHSIE